MTTAFIIHGFNGDTIETFGPSLKFFLEKNGYKVLMPKFPIRSEATFDKWSKILDEYINYFNKDTIVIAHSIGNPFFIKYLFNNALNIFLYISVAGFCDLFTVENRNDLNKAFIDFAVDDKHIEYLINSVKFRYSLYSDNDHVIPYNLLKKFITQINSIPVFIKGVGHMGNRNKITRLPQIEDIIKELF